MGKPVHNPHRLTPREIEVLALVSRGRSAKEIGEELGIAAKTVDKYVAHAMDRYQARNRSHLVAMVTADGLI